MQWLITRDEIDAGRNVGTGTFKGNPETLPHNFRLLDGDGNVYYHGRSNDATSQAAFDPLDWATPYAGCTAIEYWRAGRWEML